MDEVHIPDAGLRPSAELLTELQRSEGRESCEEQADTSIQETGSTHVSNSSSNKETCANTLSIPPTQAFLYTKRTIPTNDGKWKVIHAHSPDGGDLATAVSKMVTRMVRHTTKMSVNLTAQCIGTQLGQYCWKRLQNMEHEMSQKSIGYTLFMQDAARQELSTVRIPQNP